MENADDEFRQRLAMLGERLRAERQRAGLSQEGLADLVGLHRTYVGSVERGERNVSVRNIWALADALDVSPAVFVTARGSVDGTR